MGKPVVFGAGYSVYVRAVRLALQEKGVEYDLVPVDVFAEGGPPSSHLARQPFGHIPAFEHDGFELYETGAITRYIDEAFDGPALQPTGPRSRARVNQIISIADGYIYPVLVWGIYVEQVAKPERGEPCNDHVLSASLAKAPVILKALADLMGGNPWLGGAALSLADLHAAPMIDYFAQAPEGLPMLSRHANLKAWWLRMQERRSMRLTQPVE